MEQGLKIARHRVGPHYYQLISTVPLSVCFSFLLPRKKACRMGSKGYQEKTVIDPRRSITRSLEGSVHDIQKPEPGWDFVLLLAFFFSVCSISFFLDFLLLYNKPP